MLADNNQNNFFCGEKEEIKKHLLKSDDELGHVLEPSIILSGPGGVGKATMAKQVYDDYKIRRRFHRFAWVSMADDDFQPEKVMRSVVAQLVPTAKKRVREMSYLGLMGKLLKVQQEKRCLIVLCNVRDGAKWRTLRTAFLVDANTKTRSRLLLTTPDKSIQTDAGKLFAINALDENQSWQLLRMRLNSEIKSLDDPSRTKKLKEIVRQCKGSQLAINILTAAYLNIARRLSDWERVSTYLRTKQPSSDVEEIVQHVLSFCYSELPDQQLRQCFLYLGHFPADHDIQLDQLYIRWIDESLVLLEADDGRKKIMDVAKSYLKTLVDRNLVQMVSTTSCKLHLLVRDFCIKNAETEKVYKMVVQSDQPRINSVVPRLSLIDYQWSRKPTDQHLFLPPKLHSLSLFDSWEPLISDSMQEPIYLIMEDRESLQFLEFDGVDLRKWNILNQIGELIHLRHLSFQRCYYINTLPLSIGRLSQLETLDLRVLPHCKMSLPNVLSRLRQLRRLYLPQRFECHDSSAKLKLNSLKELEILVNFNTRMCDVRDLRVMEKLQRVHVIVEEDRQDLEAVIDFVDHTLSHLHDSSLDVRNFNCYSESKRVVLRKLLSCRRLGNLRLEGIIKTLPQDIGPNLSELEISGAELKQNPMPRLGQILQLQSLTLHNDAYVGKSLNCPESTFPELRNLKLKNLRCLENWAVEDGSMLKLSRVSIVKCGRLSALPDGLRFLKELRELKIVAMPAEFEARLQVVEGKEGADIGKVKQVPSIKILS